MDSLKSNRAFKYGDGIFETIRYANSRIYFIEDHFERLKLGFQLLHFTEPEGFSVNWLQREIHSYIGSNNFEKEANVRIRISFWRNGSGFYTPLDHSVNCLFEHNEISSNEYKLNENGLKVDWFNEAKISNDKFSTIKKIAALPYVLASIYKESNKLDDVLLINNHNRIIEASSSNIFLIIDNKIITPDLKEGPVAGVMRKQIIQLSYKLGLTVIETKLSKRDFEKADEILLTNVVNGVKWVKDFKMIPNKTYGHKFAQKFTTLLNEL